MVVMVEAADEAEGVKRQFDGKDPDRDDSRLFAPVAV